MRLSNERSHLCLMHVHDPSMHAQEATCTTSCLGELAVGEQKTCPFERKHVGNPDGARGLVWHSPAFWSMNQQVEDSLSFPASLTLSVTLLNQSNASIIPESNSTSQFLFD